MLKEPITTTSSQYVYQNHYFKVRHDHILYCSNQPGNYYVVERNDFVAIIVIHQHQFYLVEQYRHPIKSLSLEFPMGLIEPGETADAAALRELQEETGLVAGKLDLLGYIHIGPGYQTQGFSVFIATNCTQHSSSLELGESTIKVKVLSNQDLHQAVRTNQIKDGPTLAAYSLYITNL